MLFLFELLVWIRKKILTLNADTFAKLLTDKFDALELGKKSSQTSLMKVNSEQGVATHASFRVALEITKREKPLTDGETIKKSVHRVTDENHSYQCLV